MSLEMYGNLKKNSRHIHILSSSVMLSNVDLLGIDSVIQFCIRRLEEVTKRRMNQS